MNYIDVKLNQSDFKILNNCPACGGIEFDHVGTSPTINRRSTLQVHIYRCILCGHWRVNPVPKQRLLDKLYLTENLYVVGEGWADTVRRENERNQNQGVQFEDTNTWITSSLRFTVPGSALEIGSGSGHLLFALREMGWHVKGIDPGGYANNQYTSKDSSFISDRYDVIIFQDVLEHVEDPDSLLHYYSQYLTKRAKLFLAVPWSESLIAKNLGSRWDMVRPLGHLHFFSHRSIEIILLNNDFLIDSIKNIDIRSERLPKIDGPQCDQIFVEATFKR
jgi:hypothetical protein